MRREYKHLNHDERDKIMELKALGYTVSAIAETVGRSKGTISRELKRNSAPCYEVYLSHKAHARAALRKQQAGQRPRLKNEQIVRYVREKLFEGWSPELISGRIVMENPKLSISHEAIYQYLYHPETEGREALIHCLVRSHRRRRKKGIGRKQKKTKIPNRVPIEERPVSAENRSRYGHWEGDSVVSRKSLVVLNSLLERKSRLLLLTKMDRKTADLTVESVAQRLGEFPKNLRRTLTLDNGTENAGHEEITKRIGTRCYFADPYASWQRGSIERANGLVRRSFPKGTDFGKVTEKEVAEVEWRINNRPMKCLGFKTPLEAASVALPR